MLMKKQKKVIVVLSGGMDSTTLLYRMFNEYSEVEALSFNYGQRHKKELEYAAKSCAKLGIPHKIVDVTVINELVQGSSLTSDIDVPEGHYEEENMKATVVPNRNMILASMAIGYAVSKGFGAVALGVHSGDHAIYPDCRPLFVDALRVMARIANYEEIEILAPYLDTDKGGILRDGIELGVDYSLSWTCYKGGEKACGKCGSCQERLAGFKENGIEDPLEYDTREFIPKKS